MRALDLVSHFGLSRARRSSFGFHVLWMSYWSARGCLWAWPWQLWHHDRPPRCVVAYTVRRQGPHVDCCRVTDWVGDCGAGSVWERNRPIACHTRFRKEDQMYLICALGSSFTHMEDVISEYIRSNVQQPKQKRISTLLHTPIDRHEGLNVSPITYTISPEYLHELPQELWLVNAPRVPQSHWSSPLHCSLLNSN